VLLLLAAMMATVGVLKTTGVFPWAVAQILRRARGRPWIIQRSVAWFTGVVSAFADNVTTVVFVTPMVAVAIPLVARLAGYGFGAAGVVQPVCCLVSAIWVILQPSASFASMKASTPQWLQVVPSRKSYRAQTMARSPSILISGS